MVSKKDFILDSAQKLFIEQGFDQTSIAQLLEVTQIARGTLYYYFSSKEEIMDAIIERSVAQAFSKAELLASKKEGSILERLMGALLAKSKDRKFWHIYTNHKMPCSMKRQIKSCWNAGLRSFSPLSKMHLQKER